MDAPKGVPVEQPAKSDRVEQGRLTDHAATGFGSDLELEPGPTGQTHLRRQTKESAGLDGLDAPEVQCVARRQRIRIPTPAAQARSTGGEIE